VPSLSEYRRKRQFDLTPEPKGQIRDHQGKRFVVQEHHARRLHYDLRLEVQGVLKSWAVPKGPSLDPQDKRLAIQTEDHPLEYGDFEGEIPRGNYGAGQVTIWDKGTFEVEGSQAAEQQIDRGELKFRLHGAKLKGSFVLVRMRNQEAKKEWLLIKHADEFAQPGWDMERAGRASIRTNRDPTAQRVPAESQRGGALSPPAIPSGARKAPLLEMIRPALATLSDRPFSSPDWLFEIKWDGLRTLARISEGKARLWSRSNRETTREYPELSDLAQHVAAREAWLDGEIIVLDKDGRSDFQQLQLRFSVLQPSAELIRKAPVVFYVFDLLYLDGYDLRRVPLIERKELLRKILVGDSRVRYSDHVIEKGDELYELAVSKALEGLVAKKITSAYPEGRSSAWVKIKLDRDVDAVVGGWTAPRGSREYFGALQLGLYDNNNQLQFIGGVGTGFSREVQSLMWKRLQRLKTVTCPFVNPPVTKEQAFWVKPEPVARVKFSSWTADWHLRAPRFLGLQEDRDPKTCTFEEQMNSTSDPATDTRPEAAPAAASETVNVEAPILASQRVGIHAGPARAVRVAKARKSPTETVLDSDAAIQKELEEGSAESIVAQVDGRRLQFTNLNKVYFPQHGYTKRNLLAYYFRVAPLILPFLKDRPLVLRRYPNGIEGEPFFQKDAAKETPDWVRTATIQSEDRNKAIRYIMANDRATLLYLTNLGCIDHNPWSSRYNNQHHPDYIFFDLDPTPDTPFSAVAQVGRLVLGKLGELAVTAYAKTSGATGIHIFVPVEPRYSFEQARMFVMAIASMVNKEHPGLITFERSVQKRPKGRVYMDAHQNSRGQSLASVYSVRAFPDAPASAPVKTRELTATLKPEKWNLKSMTHRLRTAGDLWAGFWERKQQLETLFDAREKPSDR
jgi:bifunctional non-homologous end joining protein LigD